MNHGLLGTLAWWGGLVTVLLGLLTGSRETMALGCTAAGLGFAWRDRERPGGRGLDNLSFFALSGVLWFGLGNFFGYLAWGTSWQSWFYQWEVEERLTQAQRIASVGFVAPLLAGRAMDVLLGRRTLDVLLPGRAIALSDRALVRIASAVILFSVMARFAGALLPSLGSLGAIVRLGPNGMVFLLTMRRLSPGNTLPRWTSSFVLAVVVAEVLSGFLFGYLRVQIIWPPLALLLPYLLRRRVSYRHLAISGACFVAFLPVFEYLGNVRATDLRGVERFGGLSRAYSGEDLGAMAEEDFGSVQSGAATLCARFTTYSQLSHIADIVAVEGFYEGETLAYLRYVFIPRMFWPEKPEVSPGRWFAEKIGRGWYADNGKWSNAVNMTVPGELYLNFGYTGVVIGMIIMAVLYRVLWDATRVRTESCNPVGQVFAFLALTQAVFSGSHAGAIANLAIWILLLHLGSWTLAVITGPARTKARGEPLRTGVQA